MLESALAAFVFVLTTGLFRLFITKQQNLQLSELEHRLEKIETQTEITIRQLTHLDTVMSKILYGERQDCIKLKDKLPTQQGSPTAEYLRQNETMIGDSAALPNVSDRNEVIRQCRHDTLPDEDLMAMLERNGLIQGKAMEQNIPDKTLLTEYCKQIEATLKVEDATGKIKTVKRRDVFTDIREILIAYNINLLMAEGMFEDLKNSMYLYWKSR